MTDTAYTNAIRRRDEIAAEINEYQQRLDDLRKEMSTINQFVHQWHTFAGVPEDTAASLTYSSLDDGGGRPKNPPKEEVGRIVYELIDKRGMPIGRDLLYDALVAEGVELKGSNPRMVLSTMLWRMSDKFKRLRGHGYWIKGRPYPPAQYTGDEEDAGTGTPQGDLLKS